ncbi:MAG: hypothetical protein HYZ50_00050 [Deltaproteobacteria bacterium]|nr:hypothetical protein [Deltaproteobacteria bacterium]
MQTKQMFSIGALVLALASWNVAAQAEGANTGGENGQAAPAATGSESFQTFQEVLPGAISADIWDVKCLGPVTYIAVRACDNGALDDTFDISIVGYAPGLLNQGDRGFLQRGSFGGCTFYAYAARPAGKPGSIKAYVTVSQQGGTGSGYNLDVFCNGTNLAPVAKLVRDSD